MTRPDPGAPGRRAAIDGPKAPTDRLDSSLGPLDYGRETIETTAGEAPTFDTGTTVVALAAADGVAMAADQRMSLGGRFTANKNARKIEAVHPRGAMAISGSVGPAQEVLRTLRAEADLYEARRGERMSADALARTAGRHLRGLPVSPLLGAVDDEGGHVYELDGAGSVTEDRYAAGGSGMQVAYGLLEDRFEPDAPLADASRVARTAIGAASERDTASGDGVTVAAITDEGVEIAESEADAAERDSAEVRD